MQKILMLGGGGGLGSGYFCAVQIWWPPSEFVYIVFPSSFVQITSPEDKTNQIIFFKGYMSHSTIFVLILK